MSQRVRTATRSPIVAIMGDLVRSEAACSPEALHKVFNAAIDEANRDYEQDLASPLTITLGDEFQGLCHDLQAGIFIVRQLRWRLLEAEAPCRFALGLVSLSTPLNTARAWNMMGAGLAETRAKLGDKRDENAYRFHLPGKAMTERLLEAVGLSLSAIEADWTPRQKAIVLASMDAAAKGQSLARQFELSPGVFYKIRRAGRFDLYRTQWTAVTEALAALDEGND